MSSLYIFTTRQQAVNIDRNYDLFSFNFGPLRCKSEKFYVLLEENNIKILDAYMNLMYTGSINLDESRFNPRNKLKLVYELDDGVNYIGGNFILEKGVGTLIHNGSGLKFLAAYKGCIKKVTRPYE